MVAFETLSRARDHGGRRVKKRSMFEPVWEETEKWVGKGWEISVRPARIWIQAAEWGV
jgi:hypothetical protein